MKIFVRLSVYAAWVALAACEKAASPPAAGAAPKLQTSTPSATPAQPSQQETAAKFNACTLLTNEEVGEVQGSPVKDTKSSERSSQGVTVAQCFYTTTEFSRSINLSVTRRDASASGSRGPRDLWHDSFGRFSSGEHEAEEDHDAPKPSGREGGEREREKESKPPLKVEGLGEEAFWTSGIGGTLYVLKGEAFIRISIGGPDKDEAKLNQAKALAAKAIDRL